MEDTLILARIQFAFTIMYHYLFPQLTMGLSLLIVFMKAAFLFTKKPSYNHGAQFWARIFAVNFAMGVVTGIPMEFQFGTNWSRFSLYAGGIIGQLLAMEGIFAFFLESAFLGLFLFGERRLGQRLHFFAAFMVFFGTWLSGYFIILTDAWMQNPVGYAIQNGRVVLTDFWALFTNPWAFWQYAHNMLASVVTASFVCAAAGAYYALAGRDLIYAKMFLRLGICSAVVSLTLVIMPTGDAQGQNVALRQPATLAAMEGLFETKESAEIVLVGQPDMERLRIDNPIVVPGVLSMLTYKRWKAEVKGLDSFPRDQWPTNVPLLYYSYHVMVGLGTMLLTLAGFSALLLWKDRLLLAKPILWFLMLAFPFPYIANTAGWMTAELGRQPWLVYGLMRTSEGTSPLISSGNTLFTLLGYMGMYALLSVVFVFVVGSEIKKGPEHLQNH